MFTRSGKLYYKCCWHVREFFLSDLHTQAWQEVDLEVCVFPNFVLSDVYSFRHLGDNVCCRQSCPGAFMDIPESRRFREKTSFRQRKRCGFTDSPIKVRVREPVVKSGMNKYVCADMCSEQEVLWPPSMGRERNICFCSKCVFMISDTGNDSGFILTALWRSCQVFPQLFPPGSS